MEEGEGVAQVLVDQAEASLSTKILHMITTAHFSPNKTTESEAQEIIQVRNEFEAGGHRFYLENWRK